MASYCVGLTGGVGCGKSSAAGLFAELGAALVDTDVIAHELTAASGSAMPMIRAAFGEAVIAADGRLDRAVMRRLVFADGAARLRLEQILHPLIHHEALRQAATAEAPYVLLVVPLLVEHYGEYQPILARVALVDCDEDQQMARTAARPGLDFKQARAILAAQSPRAARLAIADDRIDNRGTLAELRAQIERLHAYYLGHPDRNR